MAFNHVSTPGAETPLVQNRLTVAGLALTTLIFSGTFSLGLYNSWPRTGNAEESDYRREFLHIEVALALGIIAALLSIACFLVSQQTRGDGEEPAPAPAPGRVARWKRWYLARGWWILRREWWYSAGQVFLYLALAQALSAGASEVVFGIGLAGEPVARIVGWCALAVWLLLLFFAPVGFLIRLGGAPGRAGSAVLAMLYLGGVLTMLLVGAASYHVQAGRRAVAALSWEGLLEQVVQPLHWHECWEGSTFTPCVERELTHAYAAAPARRGWKVSSLRMLPLDSAPPRTGAWTVRAEVCATSPEGWTLKDTVRATHPQPGGGWEVDSTTVAGARPMREMEAARIDCAP